MFRRRTFLNVLACTLLLLWATAVQGQLNRGVMEGTVTDPQGAVVPGVEVTRAVAELGHFAGQYLDQKGVPTEGVEHG